MSIDNIIIAACFVISVFGTGMLVGAALALL